MVFVYILCTILFLVLEFVIANEFGNIAEEKGYEGGKYAAYTFFFGVVGMLMVVALPKKDKTKAEKSNKKAETKTKTSVKVSVNAPKPAKKAAEAEEDFGGDAFVDTVCANCGKELSVLVGEETITCPWCDAELDVQQ